MGYVFVSYSSKDREVVLRLANDLSQQGFQVWLDQRHITGQRPYWTEIKQGIEIASHFLFVVSPDSILETSGAYTELLHAASLNPPPVIVPVMARQTPFAALPIVITPGRYQIHDFARLGYVDALRRTLVALEGAKTAPQPTRAQSGIHALPDTSQTTGGFAAVQPSQPQPAVSAPLAYSSPAVPQPKYIPATALQRKSRRNNTLWFGLAGLGALAMVCLVGTVALVVLGRLQSARPTASFGAQGATNTVAVLASTRVAPTSTSADLVLLPTQPAATAAVQQTCFLTPVNQAVNVRTGPGVNYNVVGQLAVGLTAPITGKNADGSWWRINFSGSEAWITGLNTLVTVAGDCASVPLVSAPPTPVAPTAVLPTATPIFLPTLPPFVPSATLVFIPTTLPFLPTATPIPFDPPTAVAGQPDLSPVTWEVSEGGTHVTVYVRNNGTASASTFVVTVVWTTVSGAKAVDTAAIASLRPGVTASALLRVSGLSFVKDRLSQILVAVDDGNQIKESNEGNNVVKL